MRREFELTEEQLTKLLDASKPTPCMKIGTYVTPTPQQNANRAWGILGTEMQFKPMTVKPIEDKGDRFFTAEAIR